MRRRKPPALRHLRGQEDAAHVYGADGTRRKKTRNFSPTQSCDAPTASQPVTLYLGNVEIRNRGQGNAEEILLYPVPQVRIALTKDAGGGGGHQGLDVAPGCFGVGPRRDQRGRPEGGTLALPPVRRGAFNPLRPGNGGRDQGLHRPTLRADAWLQYLNARYYDPKLAMFIQPDWWEVMKAGVGTNRYGYTYGDSINQSDPGGHSWLDRAWDSVFGGGSFNRTFGDRGLAWSDRTFGNSREREVGRQFKNDVGTKTDRELINNRQKWWSNYNGYKSTRNFSASGVAAQGDSFVVDAVLLGTGAGAVYKAGRWVYTGAKASLNGAMVFWTGMGAQSEVKARIGAEAYAKATGATTLEMTLTGKAMDLLQRSGVRKFSSETWDWASRRFAAGAKEATVFVGNGGAASPTSIWSRIEAPKLIESGVNWVTRVWD